MPDVASPAGALDRSGRDASRSPMQWDPTPAGGFSPATPWLPVGDAAAHNVADQRDDPASTLSLYRALIGLRHDVDAIGLGSQRSIDLPADLPAVAFTRHGSSGVLVAVNCGSAPLELDLRTVSRGRLSATATLRLSTDASRDAREPVALDRLGLGPNEAVVLDLG